MRKRNAAWWVDAGYMISPTIGIEADYLHFGALYDHVSGKYTPTGGASEGVIAATLVRSDGLVNYNVDMASVGLSYAF